MSRRASVPTLAAVLLAGLVPVVAGCDQDTPTPAEDTANPTPKPECGSGRAGSKAAFRQLATILASGDEGRIHTALADAPRFAWISALDIPGPELNVKDNPEKAARVVAQRGGLPITITDFQNIERPSRTTDAGFGWRWGGEGELPRNDQLIGKGAIDCTEGKAIVLSLAGPGSE